MRSINHARIQTQLAIAREWFRAEKPLFQIACSVVLLGHILTYIGPLYDYLSLTPDSIFVFRLWKPFLAPLMEANPFLLAWSLLALHQLLHIIEPVWGFPEVVKFSLITHLVSTLLISLLGLALFAIFQSIDFFYYTRINGVAPLSAGALVAVKQFLPDTVLVTTSRGRLKNTHLPLSALSILLVLSLSGLVRFSAVLQTAVGIQVSWTYLRFIQRNKLNNCKGDDSDHFAWSTLFPRITRPLTSLIGNAAYYSLVNLKLLRKVENVVLPSVVEQSTIELDADSAADRKRQIALRELQARLMQQKQRSSQSPLPNRATSLEPLIERNETMGSDPSPTPQHAQQEGALNIPMS